MDSLRFMMSIILVVAHGEFRKDQLDIENYIHLFLKPKIGGSTVTFFLVLSGFLLTMMLLEERKQNGYTSIRNFYIRRILRLWPVYFVYLGVFFLVTQAIDFPIRQDKFPPIIHNVWPFFILHLDNLIPFMPPVFGIGHLWSLSVEEQFYVAWPIMVKYCKKLLKTLIIITLILVALKLIFSMGIFLSGKSPAFAYQFRHFLTLSRYECIIIGCMGAIIYHYYPSTRDFLYQKKVQWACIVGVILTLVMGYFTTYIDQFIISIPLTILLLNMATNTNSVLWCNIGFMNSLGRRSYSIYIWHPLIVLLTSYFVANEWGLNWDWKINMIYYAIIVIGTICVAYLSYWLIEKPFLRLKPY